MKILRWKSDSHLPLGISAKHLLNQWSIHAITALGILIAAFSGSVEANPAWIDKVYTICTTPNQSMKEVSQQLAKEGFARANFNDAVSFSDLMIKSNILQSFNAKSTQVSVEAHISQNSSNIKSAANTFLAAGIPIFWLDDAKLSALVVGKWLFSDNKPTSCEIFTNDAASLTQLIERESDKRLGGGSSEGPFAKRHEYFLSGPLKNSIFKIFLETVSENGVREFGVFIGETKAFMRIYQVRG